MHSAYIAAVAVVAVEAAVRWAAAIEVIAFAHFVRGGKSDCGER